MAPLPFRRGCGHTPLTDFKLIIFRNNRATFGVKKWQKGRKKSSDLVEDAKIGPQILFELPLPLK